MSIATGASPIQPSPLSAILPRIRRAHLAAHFKFNGPSDELHSCPSETGNSRLRFRNDFLKACRPPGQLFQSLWISK
jgi:hypothetical protein